jgi:hypothetical protein
MLISVVTGYFVMAHYYSVVPDAISSGNAVAVAQAGMLMVGWSVVSLLLSAMMYVVVTRQALGLREGPAVFHFAFGMPELRVFGGLLGLTALLILFVVASLMIAGLVSALGKSVAALVGVLEVMAIVYAMIRLSFLFIPASVAEGKVGLAESWQLTSGNFWNIVAIGFAVMVPLMIVVGMTQVLVAGPDALLSNPAPPGADAAQHMKAMADQMHAMARHLPILSGLTFLFAPFATGLTLAPAAYAYRAVRDGRMAGSGTDLNI